MHLCALILLRDTQFDHTHLLNQGDISLHPATRHIPMIDFTGEHHISPDDPDVIQSSTTTLPILLGMMVTIDVDCADGKELHI